MNAITLVKDWGRHKAGSVFRVWSNGERPAQAAVDAQRAAQLVTDGLAVEGEQRPKAPPSKQHEQKSAREKEA